MVLGNTVNYGIGYVKLWYEIRVYDIINIMVKVHGSIDTLL